MILILIHHIHLLMYVPTIAVIVVLRHYLVQGLNRSNLLIGAASVLGVGLLFAAAQFYGTVTVPPEAFVHYLQGRMAEPSRTDLLGFSYIWYQPLSKEIHDTWQRMPSNLLGVPVYALLIWLHTPLWRYFAASIRALAVERHRRVVVAALSGQRGLSDHLCHRVRLFALGLELGGLPVPASVCGERPCRLRARCHRYRPDDRTTSVLGWIVTILPRVGIVRPF